jgi:hypothetical protein
MPRPRTIVKNNLSLAIAELRRRLGHSQQSWANSLGLSMGACARWELNQFPDRKLLERLISLATENGFADLQNTLWRAYRREFGLAYEAALAMDVAVGVKQAITLTDQLPVPKQPDLRRVLENLKEILRRLDQESLAVLAEHDQSGKDTSEPPNQKEKPA